MYVDGVAEPMWRRVPQPQQLPHWLSPAALEHYVGSFGRSGFHGGLCWYVG